LYLFRHINFLKAVCYHSITAFGGPQVTVGLMHNRFVETRKDITEEELMEYNAFCQLLPGASSTQTIVLVGFKRGGVPLALLTLLVWIFPAATIMACLAILFSHYKIAWILKSLLLLQPMSVGFIASAALLLFKKAVNNVITRWIFIISCAITFVGFNSPWTIPIIIILSGIVTNFSKKRIPESGDAPKSIKWISIVVFAFLFIVAGFFSEKSATENWKHKKVFNLFENNYRFGSLVFGGGDVLIPIMYEQYVTRPQSDHIKKSKRDVISISSETFLTGSGLVRAVPGPIFSISSYMGAIALKDSGIIWQFIGAAVASAGIFLPSFLIVLFFFPIWQKLKKFALFYRSLEGIYAAIVGVMTGATLYLAKDIALKLSATNSLQIGTYIIIFIASTYLLYKHKLAPQWIALSCLLLGALLSNWI
jgi:chromate transporter